MQGKRCEMLYSHVSETTIKREWITPQYKITFALNIKQIIVRIRNICINLHVRANERLRQL